MNLFSDLSPLGKRKADDDVAAPAKKAKTDADETETTSIFVGQLSWNVDDAWLQSEFESCGTITSATVQNDRNTGRSRGFGYVHFADPASVEKALETMNGKEIDGRPIKVDKSTPPSHSPEKRAKQFNDQVSAPSSTLFIGNLSFSVNEDMVWESFNDYGVKNVRLPTDRDTGKFKGFGYVEFEDIDGAKKAFDAMKGQEIDGRTIRLDFSQPRDNSGGGGGGGRGGFGGGRGGGFGGRGGGGFGGRGGGRGGGDRGGRGGGRGRGTDRGYGGRGRGGGNVRSGGIATDGGRAKITF